MLMTNTAPMPKRPCATGDPLTLSPQSAKSVDTIYDVGSGSHYGPVSSSQFLFACGILVTFADVAVVDPARSGGRADSRISHNAVMYRGVTRSCWRRAANEVAAITAPSPQLAGPVPQASRDPELSRARTA